ncbi:MAG: cation:proton antiporter [Candidatus Thermoplasmatota archaeon]|nr:cation:proton antiporter [Candidatus Thermoplasmatota archaeon]
MSLFQPFDDILIGLLLLLLLSRSLGLLFHRIKISPIAGEVLGGLLLSPLLLNILSETPELLTFSEFAIIVIMFHSGLYTDFSSFRQYRWTSIVVGALGVVVSFALIFILSFLVFGMSLETSLFLGAILSNSAIEVSSAMLANTKFDKLRTIVVGASFIDDILAVFVLGVVLSFVRTTPGILLPVFGEVTGITSSVLSLVWTSLKVVAFLLVTFYVLSKLSHKILDRFAAKRFEIILSVGFLFALGLGIFAKWVGLHEVIGVYLAGLILSQWGVTPDPMLTRGIAWMKFKRSFTNMMEALFSPIFFGVVGLLLGTNLVNEGGDSVPFIILGVVLFSFFAFMGKIVGCGMGARLKKIVPSGALLIGVAMGGRGALEFILIKSGLKEGLLSPDEFSIVIIVTLITILLTPVLYQLTSGWKKEELEKTDL